MKYLLYLSILIVIASCSQSSENSNDSSDKIKIKDLGLKEKELELKEKELKISKSQDILLSETHSTISFNKDSIEALAEKRLKTFLKVEEDAKGWFNSFTTTLYNKGETVARRGQVSNYLWSNEKLVAFHFFTYGGGSNNHYITCVDSKGHLTTIQHVLTQNLQGNIRNVERYEEDQILCTEETLEMYANNPGDRAKKTYVSAVIYGINTDGKLTKTSFK